VNETPFRRFDFDGVVNDDFVFVVLWNDDFVVRGSLLGRVG